jgi:ribonuclease D
MAFDTEFIPEKYYRYKLCVISVATSKGNYLIDVLKLKRINGFLKLIEDPSILKITHAGENDYQLLVENYGAMPVNVFDTQLAYGFLQYDYPVGLQTLLSRLSNVKLDKGALRSDWEKRPLSSEQCKYAVQDVVYLHSLMISLKRRLKKNGKLDWAEMENRRLQDSTFYQSDPLDFLNAAQLNQMSQKEKVFLLRMHLWRQLEAEKEDRPVTVVLKTRVLNTIVQKMSQGEAALLKDRTLPGRFIRQHIHTFKQLYKKRIAPHEQELLDQIPATSGVSPRMGILIDILHQLMKHRGLEHRVSPKLIISSKELHRMKTNPDYIPRALTDGWRKELLGEDLIKLLGNRGEFDIDIKKNKFILKMEPNSPSLLKRFLKKKS